MKRKHEDVLCGLFMKNILTLFVPAPDVTFMWRVSVHISLYFAIYYTGEIVICKLVTFLFVTVTPW